MIVSTTTAQAQSYQADLDSEQQYGKGVIEATAHYYEVSVDDMLRVAWCESRYRPSARGDNRRSHSIYQLNDLETGLIWHFYYEGYTDPYNPWQSAAYYARVMRGDFTGSNAPPLHPYGYITTERWSCR